MSEGILISYDAVIGVLITILLAGIGWIIHYVSKSNERYNKLDRDLLAMKLTFENNINNLKDKISELSIQKFNGRSLPRKL